MIITVPQNVIIIYRIGNCFSPENEFRTIRFSSIKTRLLSFVYSVRSIVSIFFAIKTHAQSGCQRGHDYTLSDRKITALSWFSTFVISIFASFRFASRFLVWFCLYACCVFGGVWGCGIFWIGPYSCRTRNIYDGVLTLNDTWIMSEMNAFASVLSVNCWCISEPSEVG